MNADQLRDVIRDLLSELDPWLDSIVFVDDPEEEERFQAALANARRAIS
jgi:hypothetical protein